ncbi:unnamed protein product, partial [Ceratitis capitata]
GENRDDHFIRLHWESVACASGNSKNDSNWVLAIKSRTIELERDLIAISVAVNR